ncbi:MAG: hypothetical protein WCT10_04665 [Patescibacteria group bacterium]|jgi:hypothetical protein
MLSIEQCRKADIGLADLSDDEVAALRDAVVAFVQLAFEVSVSVTGGSKIAPGLMK